MTAGNTPSRPWAVWVSDEFYGDFRTVGDQAKAVAEALKTGQPVATARWDRDRWDGPGWTEPEPVTEPDADREAEAEAS